MCRVVQPQLIFGKTDIATSSSQIRDDIPQLLQGLQYIYPMINLRRPVFTLLEMTFMLTKIFCLAEYKTA
ncbi:MAG: hypothetical protein CTY19_18470 [Methylomonas sp.]|nr:MAG: hypothetical protein CTY19_18470 [Methylomonas sp.]